MGIKLSAKFARQESEEARLARISRKRIPHDRIVTIQRMLGLVDPEPQVRARLSEGTGALSCPECNRTFAFRCISGGTGGRAMARSTPHSSGPIRVSGEARARLT